VHRPPEITPVRCVLVLQEALRLKEKSVADEVVVVSLGGKASQVCDAAGRRHAAGGKFVLLDQAGTVTGYTRLDEADQLG
jgi:hypothetical protein